MRYDIVLQEPEQGFCCIPTMTSNSTSDGGRRPWNQVALSAVFALFLVISPISSAQAQVAPGVTVTTTNQVVTNTQVTELTDESDMRSEIGEPAVIEVVAPLPLETLKTYQVDVTQYNSEAGQTDSTPDITADGSKTRPGIIAANFLPFNTKVRFPELFGDRVFEVHDRMNPRYNLRTDIWVENKKDALQFGLKRNVKVEVVAWGDNSKTEWKRIALENSLKRALKK